VTRDIHNNSNNNNLKNKGVKETADIALACDFCMTGNPNTPHIF